MKRRLLCSIVVIFLLSIQACVTPEPEPVTLEEVSWSELANQSLMEDNDNRYVSFKVQFLGMDIEGVASQMLYKDINHVVLLNHLSLDDSYNEQITTSLDSFLIGLPMGQDTDEFMTNTEFGKVIHIVGRTKYVVAGFGLFKHLLVNVENFEILDQ